jgi:starch synthase
MLNELNVLYITPEIVPFCKTGGLADVSGALPVELAKLGVNIKITCPYYRQVREYFDQVHKTPMIALKERSLWLGGRLQKYRVLKSFIPKSRVEVFFIDFPALFDRPHCMRSTVSIIGITFSVSRSLREHLLNSLRLLDLYPI